MQESWFQDLADGWKVDAARDAMISFVMLMT